MGVELIKRETKDKYEGDNANKKERKIYKYTVFFFFFTRDHEGFPKLFQNDDTSSNHLAFHQNHHRIHKQNQLHRFETRQTHIDD